MGLLDFLRTYGSDDEGAPDDFRLYAPRPETGPTTEIAGGAVGVDGESYQTYGYLYSGGPDQNPLLSGRNKYIVYEEMRKSDPAIKSLLWMFKLPIRGASWEVDAAGEGKDPTDRKIADAVKRQFGLDGRPGRLDLSWDQSVGQSLLMLDWGAFFEEAVWADEIETWRLDGETAVDVRPMNRLAPRAPMSIFHIQDDPNTGQITWLTQDLPGALPIPGQKIVPYVMEKEGRNWWGTSLLRPTFGSWRLKKGLMISAGISWDRYGAGIPVVYHPPGEESEKKAKQIGMNVRTHERAYVTFAGQPADKGGDWGISLLSIAGQLPDPVPLLRYYDHQIADAGLQMFAKLGSTETGSRAVGEVLGESFYMAAQSIGDDIADIRTRYAIRSFVDVNFGTQYDVPVLRVSKLQATAVDKLAVAIANLATAGFSFTDSETQNNLRHQLDLPDMPEDLAAMVDKLPDEVGLQHETIPPQDPLDGNTGNDQQINEGRGLGL